MYVVNDDGCSWINDLDRRAYIKTLDKDKSCEWLIVGAGYTGLSAARKLSELHPNQKIIIDWFNVKRDEWKKRPFKLDMPILKLLLKTSNIEK